MSLALDSSVVVDLIRGRKIEVGARFDAARARGERLVVSSVVYHELAFGALRSGRAELNLRLLDALVSALEVEPWDSDDALCAARVRAELDDLGKPIGFADTLIAGHARRRGHVLVTGNQRHFAKVRELMLADWSQPTQAVDPKAGPTSLPGARERD